MPAPRPLHPPAPRPSWGIVNRVDQPLSGRGELHDAIDAIIGREVANEKIDVRADDECLARAGQHNALDGRIGDDIRQRRSKLVHDRRIDAIERRRAIDRDRRDRVVHGNMNQR